VTKNKFVAYTLQKKYWDDKINEDVTALVRTNGENMKCTVNFICISELKKPHGYLDVRVDNWDWIVCSPE
jgi:hypothetical protein